MPDREPIRRNVDLSRNDLIRDFRVSDTFRQMFQANILPSRQSHPFSFHQHEIFGQLYETDREWIDDRHFGDHGDHARYEKLIDSVFWKHDNWSQVIFILGSMGCGKSTLIDYYLRCYCPTISSRQGQFDKKIIITLDAGNLRDKHESYQIFFNSCQEVVISACNRFNININSFVIANKLPSPGVRHWVDRSLIEMSNICRSPNSPFKYIVLVVDNIDQTPIEVQRKVFRWLSSWLNNASVSIYKLIIPIWPATLVKIQDSTTNLMRGGTQIKLGPIKKEKLIKPRIDALPWAIIQGNPLNADEIAHRVERYIKGAHALIDEQFQSKWIRRICNGDLRRELSIWEGMLSSKILYGVWEAKQSGISRSFRYDILESMIIGSYSSIKQNSYLQDCNVFNIFNIGHAHLTPRDLLVGCYALHMLKNGYRNAASWYTTLTRFGFSKDNLRTVEDNLIAMNVIHQIPPGASNNNGYVFNIHSDVVHCYFDLCDEASYLDNVAMVTPIDAKYHHKMKVTSSLVADDFVSRAMTTITFIEFVRENEAMFFSSITDLVATGTLTKQLLNSVSFPFMWKKMAIAYRARLEGLYKSQSIMLDEDKWILLLTSPILRDADMAPDSMLLPSNIFNADESKEAKEDGR